MIFFRNIAYLNPLRNEASLATGLAATLSPLLCGKSCKNLDGTLEALIRIYIKRMSMSYSLGILELLIIIKKAYYNHQKNKLWSEMP
jgi:hypothetical protein